MMGSPDYDVTILGTGPVGCALALALARLAPDPGRIALMGPDPAVRRTGQTIDPRALAMNHGSRQFLEQLGAWPDCAADILTVHVSQAGHLGRTLIDHAELGVPRLGSVVAYDALLEQLHAALAHSGVARHAARPARPSPASPLTLQADGRDLTSRVVLLSDGGHPRGLRRHYAQHAVLTVAEASNPVAGRAFERFTRTGPLALLPHPAGAALYNVVWCVRPADAPSLCALSDADFDAALQRTFGTRLGRLHRRGGTHTFALSMQAGPAVLGTGLVAVGNAAQTLHPVAGQGLNLGLRDAAQLAHTLQPWLHAPNVSVQPILDRYAARRRADRSITVALTDTLPRLFATDNPLVRHACGLGLAALDMASFLRGPLTRHLLQGQRR